MGISNLTSQEEVIVVNDVISEINNVTANDTLVSSDIVVINNIVETSISILTENIGHSNITNPFLETVSACVIRNFSSLLYNQKGNLGFI